MLLAAVAATLNGFGGGRDLAVGLSSDETDTLIRIDLSGRRTLPMLFDESKTQCPRHARIPMSASTESPIYSDVLPAASSLPASVTRPVRASTSSSSELQQNFD
ncbi:hypothetical protein GCM10020255_075590 [Rhodococcus baikonurensis]